jgi:tetratricopeptide (TPR) repeat protein
MAMCRSLLSSACLCLLHLCLITHSITSKGLTGKEAYDSGITLSQIGRHAEAAEAFWEAILGNSNQISATSATTDFDPRAALEQFMATFHRRGIPEQGLLRLAKQWKAQGLEKESIEYLQTVLTMNPKVVEAYLLLASMQTLEPNIRLKHIISALMIDPEGYHVRSPLWLSLSLCLSLSLSVSLCLSLGLSPSLTHSSC